MPGVDETLSNGFATMAPVLVGLGQSIVSQQIIEWVGFTDAWLQRRAG